jgi:hypothetical protein
LPGWRSAAPPLPHRTSTSLTAVIPSNNPCCAFASASESTSFLLSVFLSSRYPLDWIGLLQDAIGLVTKSAEISA